jgi:hypothetical protein
LFSSNRLSPSSLRLRSGGAGAAVFCLMQIPLLLLQPDGQDGVSNPGWFLNSGLTVLWMATALAVGAGILSSTTAPTIANAVSYGIGACVAMAVVLFTIGPGTIFPIVLAVGAGVAAVAVGLGYGCIAAVRRLRRHAE